MLEHDSALWVKRREIIESGGRLPAFDRLTFDRDDPIEHESSFSIARQPHSAAERLPGSEIELTNEVVRYGDILRQRQEVQPRRTQDCEAIVRQFQKSTGCYLVMTRQGMAHEVENLVMSGAAGVGPELATRTDFVERLRVELLEVPQIQ